jgi:YVTN family beta-propeller protein
MMIIAVLMMTGSESETPGQTRTSPYQVGIRADGSAVLPTDQEIHPAGKVIGLDGRPAAIAIRPDGRTAVVLRAVFGMIDPSKGPLLVCDLGSGKILQDFLPYDKADGSFGGLAYSPDGTRLYASDPSGTVIVMNVAADGRLFGAKRIVLPVGDPRARKPSGVNVAAPTQGDTNNTGYPGGMAVSPDGRWLYVAMSMNNSLIVIDLKSDSIVDEISVGNAPYTVIVDGERAYVTNQAGRLATPADYTRVSAGTSYVADPANARPVTGTVSVVDLTSRKVASTIPVGSEPTAMTLHDGLLFVANTTSDTISVIDTHSLQVIKAISIQPFPSAPFGSTPDDLTFLRNNQFVVSLGANNALAIYDWIGPTAPVVLRGLIPTAWYPAGIAFDPKREQLVVASLKGVESSRIGNSDVRAPSEKIRGRVVAFSGAVSLIKLPSKERLSQFTRTVIADNRWNRIATRKELSRAGIAPKAIPERLGEPSKLKHVVYIIKENSKYDELLGDEPRGNGEPSYVEFGRTVTPNHHALAQQFPLLDNFYVSGTVSYDGHEWADFAFVTDYIERGWGGLYKRGYGSDRLADAPSGALWENATKHGRSVEIFGEEADRFADPKSGPSWLDWFHDANVLEGKLKEPLRVRPGQFRATSDNPAVDALLYHNFPMIDTGIPDQYRVDIFLEEFRRHIADNDFPDLTIMELTDDHTSGSAPGFPTPQAQVADNDLALGRVVDAVSHSHFWNDTAIFVVEDDAANGVDHVDGHRAPMFVLSPLARRNFVDHTYYTQIDVVRTIEQILGLPPMNQNDLVATPMSTAFTDTPTLSPYAALPNEVAIDEMNPEKSASRMRQEWQRESVKLFGMRPFKPDRGDENLTKRAIWYSSFDFQRPFPGDGRILLPSEVRRRIPDGGLHRPGLDDQGSF